MRAVAPSHAPLRASRSGRHWWRTARVGLLLAAVTATLPAAAQEPRFFRIGTAATTGTYFQIGGVIASAISNPPGSPECQRGGSCGVPGLIAVAQATQGSLENVQGIASGQLEAGFVQADVAHWAWRGEGPYREKGAVKDLRALAALFPESVHIVVARDSTISAVEHLKGRRVSLGERESGTLADARLVLAAAGLKERDLTAEYLRLAQAATGIGDGSLDAFFLVGGYPVPAITELAASKPIRLVAISDEIAAKLRRDFKFFGRSTIPGDTYRALDEATATLDIRALWATSATLPDELVYNVLKALWTDQTRKLLEARHPLGKRIRVETALEGIDIPLHPGAERFYRELGMPIDTPNP
jgi:TRAP transporter TAXI family solute receptor